MPYSYQNCQPEIQAYLAEYVPLQSEILDVGTGAGAWSDTLRGWGYTAIDGIEVYEPYVAKFSLLPKYRQLVIADIRDWTLTRQYDLGILGDVLEHLTAEDARTVLDKLEQFCHRLLVVVPYLLPQNEYVGNLQETHLQADLTPALFAARYPEFVNIAERKVLAVTQGAWVWRR